MNRSIFFLASCAMIVACSGRQDLGTSGKSKAGETCSNSSDCSDDLRCTSSVCGGPDGSDRVNGSGGATSRNGSSDGATSGNGPSCDTDATCAARGGGTLEPYCKPGGDCTDCLTDEHCALSVSGHHCKVAPAATDLNFCAECVTDAHCTDPAQPRCSTGKYGNHCVDCLADADCKDATHPRCELTPGASTDGPWGYCRECLANTDCKDPSTSICRSGLCSAP